jgi:N-acetylglutamate synthase-like GNAT family acetyltransferase
MKDIEGISIRNILKPGDIGHVISLHGYLYFQEYGFDCTFEPYVAKPLSEFVLSQSDREKIWIVENQERVSGCIAIVEHSVDQAQLRWLILSPEIRGYGLGKNLVEDAIAFSRKCGYASLFLWTVDLLTTARKLYESKGFTMTEEKKHRIWGVDLVEQRFELYL